MGSFTIWNSLCGWSNIKEDIYRPPNIESAPSNQIVQEKKTNSKQTTRKSGHRYASLICITWITCIACIACITCITCIACTTCTTEISHQIISYHWHSRDNCITKIDYHWLSFIIIDYHWLSLIITDYHSIYWKSDKVTHSLSDNLKSRDASISKSA